MADSADSPLARNLRTIFLDRDGVVNEKMPEGQWVTKWADFHVLPGVPDAIAKMNRAGLRVLVASNQRGIALGRLSAADVEAMQAAFQKLLKAHGAHIDAFYFCPHDRLECNCRKPLSGMFEQARGEFPEISATTSAMIGDSLPDMEFGRRLGMLTIFIEGAREIQSPGAQKALQIANMRFDSLPDAVSALLDRR